MRNNSKGRNEYSLKQKSHHDYTTKAVSWAFKEGSFLTPQGVYIARIKRKKNNYNTISKHKTYEEAEKARKDYYDNIKEQNTKTERIMKAKFNKTKAKEIAATSFGYVLDCILGISDEGYDMSTEGEEFEQNFEEDLEELNMTITNKRIFIINQYYEEMRLGFIAATKKKYYKAKA